MGSDTHQRQMGRDGPGDPHFCTYQLWLLSGAPEESEGSMNFELKPVYYTFAVVPEFAKHEDFKAYKKSMTKRIAKELAAFLIANGYVVVEGPVRDSYQDFLRFGV